MPAIYHPGVVQIVPHYDVGSGRDAVNVLFFNTAAVGLTSAQLTTVQTAFNTQWYTLWNPWACTNVKYKGCVVTDMASNTGLQVDNSAYTPQSGGGGSSALGDQVSVLVQLHTLTRYRGGKGRLYLPGIEVTSTTGDGRTMNTTPLNTLNTQLGVLITQMSGISGSAGGPYTPILWHKKLSSAPNTTENVLNYKAVALLATQRRRLRKVSRHRRR